MLGVILIDLLALLPLRPPCFFPRRYSVVVVLYLSIKAAWRRGGDLSETPVLSGFVDLLLYFYDSMTRSTEYSVHRPQFWLLYSARYVSI